MKDVLNTIRNSRWVSRKFLVAVFTLLFIVLSDVLDLNVDAEVYWTLVGIASTYILGESIVDAKNKEVGDNKEEE